MKYNHNGTDMWNVFGKMACKELLLIFMDGIKKDPPTVQSH